jgi:hypothetical protein
MYAVTDRIMEQRRFTLYEYLLLVVLDLHVNSRKKINFIFNPTTEC